MGARGRQRDPLGDAQVEALLEAQRTELAEMAADTKHRRRLAACFSHLSLVAQIVLAVLVVVSLARPFGIEPSGRLMFLCFWHSAVLATLNAKIIAAFRERQRVRP